MSDAPPPGDAPARGRGRPGPATWVKAAFGIAVLAFGAFFIARRWDELVKVFGELSWWWVAACVPPAVIAQLAGVQAYRAIVKDLGSPLPVRPAARVYFVSQLGKYLPGAVWPVVALISVSREYHVPRRTSLAAGVLTLVVSITSALCLAAILLPVGELSTARHFWYVGLLVPLLLAALYPPVLRRALDVPLRLMKREPLGVQMSFRGTLRALGWQAVSWCFFGMHAYLLVQGLGGEHGWRAFAVSIGGFALSYGVGPMFIIAPAGAGFREAALVLTLGSIAGGSSPALALALVSRVVLVVVDFAQAGFWASWERRSRRGNGWPQSVPADR